jgi:hypothetical protein
MSKPKLLTTCRTNKHFTAYAKSHGGYIEYGGRHPKIVGPNGGSVPFPSHHGDIPVGTRRSIIRMLIEIGLGLLPLIVLWNLLGG